MSGLHSIPIIDLSLSMPEAASKIREACQDTGFFYVIKHGIDLTLQNQLEDFSQQFFKQDIQAKMALRMELGGTAWRGYFPVGAESTSGKPDLKEGLYLGTELSATHPKVAAGTPMHGPNLFPDLPGFKDVVLAYMDQVTVLGHYLMQLLSLSLGLAADYLHERYTHDPLILFRIFHYPPDNNAANIGEWGVGEHTDYGLLTILKQDACGGLQVKSRSTWIEAPPIANAFVCNIGDMLDRMTGGLYRSTPHRVRNSSGRNRYSFPLFFDPGFDTEVAPLPLGNDIVEDREERWDKESVRTLQGTYGEYLLRKVAKVFPDLDRAVLKKPIS